MRVIETLIIKVNFFVLIVIYFYYNIFQKCDFGIYRKYIIPPFCIKTNNRFKNVSKQRIEKVIHPGWEDWTPLIIFGK